MTHTGVEFQCIEYVAPRLKNNECLIQLEISIDKKIRKALSSPAGSMEPLFDQNNKTETFINSRF